jgi:hypothetical protein
MLTGVWFRITDCAADAMMQAFERQIAAVATYHLHLPSRRAADERRSADAALYAAQGPSCARSVHRMPALGTTPTCRR